MLGRLFSCCTNQAKLGPEIATTGKVSDTVAVVEEDGQWSMDAKNYASTRYRGLDAINTSTSANLRVAWTFSTGVDQIGHQITIIDTSTHSVVHVIPLSTNDSLRPVGVLVSPDGRELYIANGRGNNVAIIDLETMSIAKTIPVGQRVWGIGLSSDGKKLYAANGLSNDVSVVDLKSGRVTKTIGAGDGPWGVAVSAN